MSEHETIASVLNQYQHRGGLNWTYDEGDKCFRCTRAGGWVGEWVTEFEAIAIARAYDAAAEMDALRAALDAALDTHASLRAGIQRWINAYPNDDLASVSRVTITCAREAIAGTAAEDRFAAGRAAGLREAAAALRRSAYDSALMAKGEAAEMFADTVEALGAALPLPAQAPTPDASGLPAVEGRG